MTILHSLLLITLFLTAHSSAGYAPSPAPTAGYAPAPAPSASEFLRTSCQLTRYPEICYRTLSEYSAAVRNDPSRLAAAAVSVSLSCASDMKAYLANLTRSSNYGNDPRAAGAVRDCVSVFGDAVYFIKESLQEMRRLMGGGGEMRFQISNVQTWMSGALTNEDTCVDGFYGVGNGAGAVKAEVCGRTVGVKEVTSNALALVNGYDRW